MQFDELRDADPAYDGMEGRCLIIGGIGVPGGTYFFTVNLLERRLDTLVRDIDH